MIDVKSGPASESSQIAFKMVVESKGGNVVIIIL